ncbi:hypothetical protein JCM30237_07550 [Halolamina litorea]|uniref:Signal peptidase I n=1 Tax=Halolamina litorea TaxID=1515593 RepID=A0ABD6BQR0_9EURY|nr:signal peptidase I [Halolamina litorea]
MKTPDLETVGAIVLVLAVLPFVAYAVPQAVGATNSYVVLSDSMSPEIRAGDVVIVDDVSSDSIGVGDVITYESADSDERITHRVVAVDASDGERRFETKGDANEEADPRPVPASAVIGVVQFHIPLIGHVISFASSDLGLLLFVVLPASALAISEVYSLYRDATGGGSTEPTETTPDSRQDHGGDD